MSDLVELSKQWLGHHFKGDMQKVEILPQHTSYGQVVWFYNPETLEDYDQMLTIPMVEKLLNGESPESLKNKFQKKIDARTFQKIDCNCNDCKHLERDPIKLNNHKKSYEGTGLMDSLNFGDCKKFNKPVSFIPNTCQIETQECFKHRNG